MGLLIHHSWQRHISAERPATQPPERQRSHSCPVDNSSASCQPPERQRSMLYMRPTLTRQALGIITILFKSSLQLSIQIDVEVSVANLKDQTDCQGFQQIERKLGETRRYGEAPDLPPAKFRRLGDFGSVLRSGATAMGWTEASRRDYRCVPLEGSRWLAAIKGLGFGCLVQGRRKFVPIMLLKNYMHG